MRPIIIIEAHSFMVYSMVPSAVGVLVFAKPPSAVKELPVLILWKLLRRVDIWEKMSMQRFGVPLIFYKLFLN